MLLALEAPGPPPAPTAMTCSVPAWLGTVYWPSTPGVLKVTGAAAAAGTDWRPQSTIDALATPAAAASFRRRVLAPITSPAR
ncbi:MAG: hypothetical protein M3Z97_11000 [Candidatus Dormibacteraeota bacterium]|nr:hypothetical protein [Candidatus Dormibacteraeota bacterium]